MNKSDNIVFIYALVDPRTEEVRYIGKTINPAERMRLHMGNVDRKSPHKEAWIKQLKSAGMKPDMKILEETTLKVWRERERFWQLEFERQGAQLTNCRECGQGRSYYQSSPEYREKIKSILHQISLRPEVQAIRSAQMSARWATTEYREKMHKVHIERQRTNETRRKQSAGLKAAWERRVSDSPDGKVRVQKHTPPIVGVIDPTGNAVPPIPKIKDFCKEHNLSTSKFLDLRRGVLTSYKGWTFQHPN